MWCGAPGGAAAFQRDAGRAHYAASVVKVAIMLAVDALGAGAQQSVIVTDTFTGLDGSRVRSDWSEDNDDEPWHRLGEPATLRWLAERAIVSSSNLASNLLVERLGLDAVRAQCPPGLLVGRQIGDEAAKKAGSTNTITATAAAALVSRCVELDAAGDWWPLDVLGRQLYRDGIAAGLPDGTKVASKSGWITGVRHDAALVSPGDAAPYVLAVCTSGLPDEQALRLIRAYAAASYTARATCPAPEN